MLTTIDLRRAMVSNHAQERWRERVGLPDDLLLEALRRSLPPEASLLEKVRAWLQRGHRVNGRRDPVRVDAETEAVFVLRCTDCWSDGSPAWCVVTVTSIGLVLERESLLCRS